MDLIIYLIILGLSLVFIFLGYNLKGQGDIFTIVGFGFLFLMGVLIIPGTPGTLDYVIGSDIVKTVDGYDILDTTASYEDFTIGFFLSMAGIFGFINVYLTRKTESFKDE